jgi:TubC N-terminal docking domain
MNYAADLLLELDRLGVRLQADGDKLRFNPRSAVTPDMLARLKVHKAELLALLRNGAAVIVRVPDVPLEWIEPDDDVCVPHCPTCGSSELWETLAGTWRCQHCDAAALARSRKLAERAARLRKRSRRSR